MQNIKKVMGFPLSTIDPDGIDETVQAKAN
jgi:hypothetical protein